MANSQDALRHLHALRAEIDQRIAEVEAGRKVPAIFRAGIIGPQEASAVKVPRFVAFQYAYGEAEQGWALRDVVLGTIVCSMSGWAFLWERKDLAEQHIPTLEAARLPAQGHLISLTIPHVSHKQKRRYKVGFCYDHPGWFVLDTVNLKAVSDVRSPISKEECHIVASDLNLTV